MTYSDTWRKKREGTFISFLLQLFLGGLQTSMIATSLLAYIKYEVKYKDKGFLFGLVGAIFNVIPILFGILLSKCTDRTRKCKECILLCTFVSACGSLLYILPFSPYCLVFGRLLNGFIPITRPIMTSEISRSYESNQLQVKLPQMATMTNLGYGMGPLFALMFTTVDVWVGPLHLSYGNSCGLFLLVLTLIQLFVILMFVHNLSEEFDMKSEEVEVACTQDNEIQPSEAEPLIDKNEGSVFKTRYSVLAVIGNLTTNLDSMLILVATSILYMWTMLYYWGVSVLVIDIMHYKEQLVNIFYIIYSLGMTMLIFILSKLHLTGKHVFYVGFILTAIFLLIGACVLIITHSADVIMNKMFLLIFALGAGLSDVGEKFFLIVVFSKMLPTECQGVGESVRLTLRRLFGLVGTYLATVAMMNFRYTYIVMSATVLMLLFGLWSRRKSLYSPKPFI